MAPILHGSRVTRSSARQVRLRSALARSAGARSALINALLLTASLREDDGVMVG